MKRLSKITFYKEYDSITITKFIEGNKMNIQLDITENNNNDTEDKFLEMVFQNLSYLFLHYYQQSYYDNFKNDNFTVSFDKYKTLVINELKKVLEVYKNG